MPAGKRSRTALRSDGSNDDTYTYKSLSRSQLLAINSAFDRAAAGLSVSPVKPKSVSQTRRCDRVPKTSRSSPIESNDDGGDGGDGDEAIGSGGFLPEKSLPDGDDDGTTTGGGGFLVEDNSSNHLDHDHEESGGGFFQDSTSTSFMMVDTHTTNDTIKRDSIVKSQSSQTDRLPLDLVPTALKFLNLPSKDPDILETFEEAASSDDEDTRRRVVKGGSGSGGGRSRRKLVRRQVFTKVCAVLLESEGSRHHDKKGKLTSGRKDDGSIDDAKDKGQGKDKDADDDEEGEDEDDDGDGDDDDDDDDEFRLEDEEGAENASAEDNDEEERVPKSAKSRRQTRFSAKPVTSSPLMSGLESDHSDDEDDDEDDDDVPSSAKRTKQKSKQAKGTKQKQKPLEYDKLNPKQKASVLNTFSLFFSDVLLDPSSGVVIDPGSRVIARENIRRIAVELGEKMTDAEVDEMIEYASPNKGGQVDLAAFGRIMIDVRAV